MEVAELTAGEARDWAKYALGLSEMDAGLDSHPAVAESLRRIASFRAPLSRIALRTAAHQLLAPLSTDPDALRDLIRVQLDQLLAIGDLVEVEILNNDDTRREIYLAPPSFVEHADTFVLLGVRPGAAQLIGDIAPDSVTRHGHLRVVRSEDPDATRQTLIDYGLTQLDLDAWLRSPETSTPDQLLDEARARLAAAAPASAGIEDVELIDPSTSTRFYRGRWRQPARGDNGMFVGRRPREYGASMWCLVELEDGTVRRFVELPANHRIEHGRDEAWLTQLAIDASLGNPQTFRVERRAVDGSQTIDFFGPLPTWAERRLSVFGEAVDEKRRSLFSFTLREPDCLKMSEYLTNHLWMRASTDGVTDDG